MALPNLFQQPISETYKGLLHTSNVPIEENTLAVIYDGEGNKSSMKLGKENNGVEFSGKVKATDFSIRDFTTIVDYLYPIGAIYLTANDINPGLRFSNTVWQKVSEGRALVGVGQSQDSGNITKTYQSGNINGYHEIRLTIDNLPPHTHEGVALNNMDYNNYTGTAFFTSSEQSRQYIINNPIIREYNVTRLPIPTTHSGQLLTNQLAGNSFSLEPVGILKAANTGNGVAFDNTTPSYGVYIFQRVS